MYPVATAEAAVPKSNRERDVTNKDLLALSVTGTQLPVSYENREMVQSVPRA